MEGIALDNTGGTCSQVESKVRAFDAHCAAVAFIDTIDVLIWAYVEEMVFGLASVIVEFTLVGAWYNWTGMAACRGSEAVRTMTVVIGIP